MARKFAIMKKLHLSIAVLGFCLLSACQTIDYTNLTDGVRLAVTYSDDSKKTVISKTTQMFDKDTNEWFEAKKAAGGSYVYTAKGAADKASAQSAIESAAGGC